MTTGLECFSMLSAAARSADMAGVCGDEVRLVVRGASGCLWDREPMLSLDGDGLVRGEGGECWRYGKLLGEIMVGKTHKAPQESL